MKKNTIDMTTGNPAKHILLFAIPMILTNMGQQLYMIVDGAIVGRGVGVKALAAVGATDWCYWLILWTIGGLTHAVSTFVSRAFGFKNYREMNREIAAAITFCAIISVALTVAGLAAARPVLAFLNTPEDIYAGAVTYLTTMVAGTLVVTGYNMSASILRGLGDGRTPLIAMVIAALLNIGLDALFVFVFQWGIVGAAAASLIAQGVSFVYCMLAILKIEYICLDKEAWCFGKSRLFKMAVFGLPIVLQYVVITMGGMIMQSSINLQGSFFIAGYTATNKLNGFLQCFAMGFGLSVSTFVAQNYGALRYDRVKQGVSASVKIVSLVCVVIMGVALLTRRQLLSLFLNVNEVGGAEALEVAVRYLTIMIGCFILLHLLYVFRNALLSLGISFWPMISGFVEFAMRVLVAKGLMGQIGADALFLAEPAAWLGAVLCAVVPYYFYRKTRLCKQPARQQEIVEA